MVKIKQLSSNVYGLTMTGLCFNTCSQFKKATRELGKRLKVDGDIRLVCMGKYGLIEILEDNHAEY